MTSPDEYFQANGRIDHGKANSKANGHHHHGDAFPVVQASTWAGMPIAPRQWSVENRIPMFNVTLLSGEGAIGKSVVMTQLCVATVLGKEWFGIVPDQGAILYLSSEEDEAEFHRRLLPIVNHYRARLADLGQFHALCLAGKDAVLGAPDREDIVRPKELFNNVKTYAIKVRPRLIVVDNSADTFTGKENDRTQVRQFVNLLRGMAIEANAAVLLSSHPSLTGISTGTGLSGSTAWHNSVRARIYMKSATSSDDEAAEDDLRSLEMRKSNYGPPAEKITLRWQDGLFLPVGTGGVDWITKRAADNRVDELFVTLLSRFNANGQNVSCMLGSTYAPTQFAKLEGAGGVKVRAFAKAMQRLIDARRIEVEKSGPPSRRRSRLVVKISTP